MDKVLQKCIYNFFDEGLVKQIYFNDKISICNVANCCYVIFEKGVIELSEIPFGVIMEQKYLESIMQDNSRFYNWASKISKKELDERIVFFNDKTFELMKKEKLQNEINGSKVNLDYEQELINQFSSSKYQK